jgi:ATP-dependent Lon protease
MREYKALSADWLRERGAWQVVDRVQQIDDPGQLADNSGYSPYSVGRPPAEHFREGTEHVGRVL